ncbi:hypothetical protein K1719_041824 [Acacia pycnantha]|nr:hypothetical protein K1719_041824 [Acacia pycnantha]
MCAHTHDRQVEHNVVDHLASSIPAIDFSLLTSDMPQLHTDAVSQLGKACAEWGFFMVMNHGISEKLVEKVVNKAHNSITCRWRKRRNSKTRVPGHPSDTAQASPLKQRRFIIGEINLGVAGFVCACVAEKDSLREEVAKSK